MTFACWAITIFMLIFSALNICYYLNTKRLGLKKVIIPIGIAFLTGCFTSLLLGSLYLI
jgi:hypothetical protein